MNGKYIMLLLCLFVFNGLVAAQENNNPKGPKFTPNEMSFDFGNISENGGYAEHIFKFKNTGTAPLVITNVQASCGCTKPEWSTAPIEPGKEGFIIITFNPKGRLGPINKTATVYTNETEGMGRYNLLLKGTVVEKPSDPWAAFLDTIGRVGIEKKNLVLKTFYPGEINFIPVYIKNFNTETAYLSWSNVPDYMTIKSPDSLKADWPGELVVSIDGTKTAQKRGRMTDKLTWTIKNKEGKLLGSQPVFVTANYIDDFSKLSPLQNVNAPSIDINNSLIEYGKIKSTTNKPFVLSNTGKSDLIIHSISSDDERIQLPALKGKTIKAGESLTVNVTLKAKELLKNLDTEIVVVCNDPKGPVRLLRVTAEKTN